MQTLILQEPGHFRLAETEPPPQPGPGEALVRVHRVGICGTDLHAFRGRQPFFTYPRILGHELGVEVVALGPATEAAPPGHLAVGDRCAVEPYLNCGRCGACRRGKTNCCERLQVLGVHVDGGMREFLVVPVHKLHKSETLPLAHLALVEMLCIGGHAVRRAQVEPGEQVLVIGAGPIGLSTIQFAQIAGAEVSVLELNPSRLAFCQEQLGVAHGLDGSQDPVDALRARLDGELPTVVFDATGNAHSMQQAFQLVANGGRLVRPHVVSHLGTVIAQSASESESEVAPADDLFPAQPPEAVPGLRAQTVRIVRQALRRVVADPEGTAHHTLLIEEVPVAGKTGTAETTPDQPAHAWFAGYVPADQPRLAVVVVLEHAGEAAQAVGPVAKRLVLRMKELGMLGPRGASAWSEPSRADG